MFNSEIKGNQRCNGVYSLPEEISIKNNNITNNTKHYNNITSTTTTYKLINKLDNTNVYNNNKKYLDRQPVTTISRKSFIGNNFRDNNEVTTKFSSAPLHQQINNKTTVHSIIGLNHTNTHPKKPHNLVIEQKSKRKLLLANNNNNNKLTQQKKLQKIECEIDEFNYYQQHWFSPSFEKIKLEERSREERIEITRHEYLKRLQQIERSNLGKPNKMPDWIERRKEKKLIRINKGGRGGNSGGTLIAPKLCEVNECGKTALISAKYCTMHIMYDSRQVLFEYCTAKFADNTQCSVPVFDITHELPLCAEHARKRDNYRLYQEAKPKKIRKKVKPSAMIRPQKRNKKRRKYNNSKQIIDVGIKSSAIIADVNHQYSNANVVGEIGTASNSPELEDFHMVDQVLALNENGLEQALVSQAHLLEETDISNVLNTIQVDEFSDFFVNRNGEYEPSREEAEELEKALAAVDNDVKSLQRLSQSHGLLDSFLDEHALPDSLVQIPEMMFHNGYTACGDNLVSQSSSYLLPVEPHSHS